MKITFLQEYIGTQTGNSLYKPGMQADLPAGAWLVEMGIAYTGWGSKPQAEEFDPVEHREEIASEPVAVEPEQAEPPVDWTNVSGVSDEIAQALLYVGLTSKAALLAHGAENLTKIPGIGKKRAADLIAYAES